LTFEIWKSAPLLQDRSHPRSYRLTANDMSCWWRDAEILGKFMKDSGDADKRLLLIWRLIFGL
jgi:hypothetical protein